MKRKSLALILVAIMTIICSFAFTGCGELGDVFLDSDTGKGYTFDGFYVTFGEYPQSIKEDSVNVSDTIKDNRGYYYGDDGEYYAKVTASSSADGYKFTNGKEIEGGTEYYFKVEPVRWKVIYEPNGLNGGVSLVLSEKVLDKVSRYDKSMNDWSNSEMKGHLNGSFARLLFNGYKTALIKRMTIDNSSYSTGYDNNSNTCVNTSVKIFLPSYREVTEGQYGYYDDGDRMRQATDYLRAQGVPLYTTGEYTYGCTEYALRSPEKDDVREIRIVKKDGTIGSKYIGSSCGFAPAFFIEIQYD